MLHRFWMPPSLRIKGNMHPLSKKKIAVIGGGFSGIVTAKSFIEEMGLNCEIEVFEKSLSPGGVWRPGGLAWDEMTVNISRFTGVFSDFSWEEAFPGKIIPDYPTSKEMHLYLLAYIKHFQLAPYIKTGRQVISIIKNHREWIISWKEGNAVYKASYNNVVIATGRYQVPHIPCYKNIENYKGEICHSADYSSANHYANKKVVIIGSSLSGVAIAAELAAKWNHYPITHLIRQARWIMPTKAEINRSKIPLDLIVTRKTYQPRNYAWYLEKCGKQNQIPAWKITPQTPPADPLNVVSDTYVDEVLSNKIRVIKGEIDYFTQTGVVLKDGDEINANAIILCTGYKFDFSFLHDSLARELEKTMKLYLDTFHPKILGLAFVGITYQARGAIPPLAELQARVVAAVISGRIPLPSADKIQQIIAATPKQDGFTFANALAKELNILNFEQLKESNARLYDLLLNGPIVPAQYRAVGFGRKSEIAEKTLLQAMQAKRDFLNQDTEITNIEVTRGGALRSKL